MTFLETILTSSLFFKSLLPDPILFNILNVRDVGLKEPVKTEQVSSTKDTKKSSNTKQETNNELPDYIKVINSEELPDGATELKSESVSQNNGGYMNLFQGNSYFSEYMLNFYKKGDKVYICNTEKEPIMYVVRIKDGKPMVFIVKGNEKCIPEE